MCDLVSSRIVIEQVNPSMDVENLLLDESWKLVNLVSYVSKKKSLVDAFEIFHNSSCLLNRRRVWYRVIKYAIMLHNHTHAFSLGVESGDHSYCC